MSKMKKLLVIISAIAVSASAFSCGKDETSDAQKESSVIIDNPDDVSTTDADNKNNSDENSKSDSTSEGDTDIESPTQAPTNTSQDTTTSEENSTPSNETTTPNNNSSNSNNGGQSTPETPDTPSSNETSTPSGGNTSGSSNSNSSSNNSNPGGNSGSSSNSGSNSNSNTSSNSGGNSSSNNNESTIQTPTEAPVETPTEEVKVYTAEISLGSTPTFTGSNITTEGSNILINGGGDYLISGTVADGQLIVNTTEKVKVYLDGVSITSSVGPAIQVNDAKRFIVVLKEGTHSVLKDITQNKTLDGVICSNDTVEIKGKGSLDIIAGNAHGISSDDDVVIENGSINITSVKSGIIANDDVTINGGNLNIMGGTNGIKSKGTINVNGGYSVISGGAKEEKSSVYAAGAFTYTNGYLYAAGNAVTAPTAAAYPYVVAGFSAAKNAGSSVSLFLNGNQAVSFNPHNSFKCVMMLSPEITIGSSFSLDVDGTSYGSYTVENEQNIFTIS